MVDEDLRRLGHLAEEASPAIVRYLDALMRTGHLRTGHDAAPDRPHDLPAQVLARSYNAGVKPKQDPPGCQWIDAAEGWCIADAVIIWTIVGDRPTAQAREFYVCVRHEDIANERLTDACLEIGRRTTGSSFGIHKRPVGAPERGCVGTVRPPRRVVDLGGFGPDRLHADDAAYERRGPSDGGRP